MPIALHVSERICQRVEQEHNAKAIYMEMTFVVVIITTRFMSFPHKFVFRQATLITQYLETLVNDSVKIDERSRHRIGAAVSSVVL